MKRIAFFISAISLAALIISSCAKDKCTELVTHVTEVPVYLTEADLHPEISMEIARGLEKPGKIYFYNNYILVNEFRKGIHIIDNTNPESPEPIAFINIPGNVDMAVKSGILYADSYLDLLTIDITNPTQATLLKRDEMVFPAMWEDPQLGYAVYTEEKLVTEELDCRNRNGDIWFGIQEDVAFSSTNTSSVPGGSIGGSFARFTLAGNYLYTVSTSDMNVFDISTITSPNLVNTVNVGWNIETIFPYDGHLFIGSNTGMFIFNISADPSNPTYMSEFQHAMGCDPVFVDGNFAYVTIRTGNVCFGRINQLDVIDITDLANPQLVEEFPMENPHGLTKNDDLLFLCEGEHGLKVFDAADPSEVGRNQLQRITNFDTYDAISLSNGLLMVIGADGLYQFDFSDPNELRQVSVINVMN